MTAVNYYKDTDENSIKAAYLWDLYSARYDSREYVIVRQGKLKLSRNVNIFIEGADSLLQRFYGHDLTFTPNTFKTSPKGEQGDARYNQLYAVYTFAVDVDYKKTGNEHSDPLAYFYDEVAQLLPVQPNYVEYGHNLRLIYILAEPIKAQISSGRKLMKAIRCIQERICTRLNNELGCNAERQTLSSTYRVPGSVNSKDGSIVRIQYISGERYTVQELLDELPALPEWYESWKEKSRVGRKKGNISKIYNSYQLWTERCEKLRRVAAASSTVHREKLLFWYGVGLCYAHQVNSQDELMKALCELNKTFKQPLQEKEIRSKMRRLYELHNQYKVKDSTLIADINISESEAEEAGMAEKLTKRDRERLEKIAAGQTRQQIAEKNYLTFCEYKKRGYKKREIIAATGISEKMVEKYTTRYNKERRKKA